VVVEGPGPHEFLHARRFIVIPKEGASFLFRKLQEPILAETVEKVKWSFIRYSDVEKVAETAGKSFQPGDLEAFAAMPREVHAPKQLSLMYMKSALNLPE
jgi:hypothetical protein